MYLNNLIKNHTIPQAQKINCPTAPIVTIFAGKKCTTNIAIPYQMPIINGANINLLNHSPMDSAA